MADLNSNLMMVDHAAINAGLDFRRRFTPSGFFRIQ
jgi:hypothetical protein